MKQDKRNTFNYIDTPNHIGFISMEEDDTRRHKSRCHYLNKENKQCKHAGSPYYERKCGGSAHCLCYEESVAIPDILTEKEEPIAPPAFAPSTHFSKYRAKKLQNIGAVDIVDDAVEDTDDISTSDNTSDNNYSNTLQCQPEHPPVPLKEKLHMNFDSISRTLKSEFPNEVESIIDSLNDINEELENIIEHVSELTVTGIKEGNIQESISTLAVYEQFLNKIHFNKNEIKKLINQLS